MTYLNLRLLFFALILVFPFQLYGQNRQLDRAEDAFSKGEYHEAIDLYRRAYSSISDRELRAEIIFKVARCYFLVSDSRQAEIWFRRGVGQNYPYPEIYLLFAETLKMNEKYEEAIDNFRQYNRLVPNDPRGITGIESSELAIKWMENPSPFEITEIRQFNSRENDFAPSYASNDYSVLYFTSSRKSGSNNRHGATGQFFSNIYESRIDRQGRWSVPAPVSVLNSDFEEGATSFNFDFSEIYFTSCSAVRRQVNGCQIFWSTRRGNQWSNPEAINLAPDSLISAHPAISPDELTLYFVSDMPGSIGGKDIWRVSRNSRGDSWGEPVNLGPEINSEGDEIFPYVHPDGTLYFSSNGHPGMGGFDIFRANRTTDGTWVVDNMGYPLNSPKDDFGIVFEKDSYKGFFSSNRGRAGIDNIYSFYLPPLQFNVTGVVTDEDSDDPIAASSIRLVGSDGTVVDSKTGTSGNFRFMLNPNVDYVLVASQNGYLSGKSVLSTRGVDVSKEFEAVVTLKSHARPIEIPNILYDFGSAELRDESKTALERLVEILNDNPTIRIELASHTDSRGAAAFNLDLSQRRAQVVVEFLIGRGISTERLTAVGYGKSRPRVIDEILEAEYSFLNYDTILTEEFINSLQEEAQQEQAHQLNRRTEFEVIGTDYR